MNISTFFFLLTISVSSFSGSFIISKESAKTIVTDLRNEFEAGDDHLPDERAEVIDMTDKKVFACGNIYYNEYFDGNYKKVRYNLRSLANEFGIKNHRNLAIFCIDDQGDGDLIMVDRKKLSIFLLNPHNKEILR